MKEHCRRIASIILVIGVIGTAAVLIQWWINRKWMGTVAFITALVSLAAVGVTVYLAYVLWSSLEEILGREERLQSEFDLMDKRLMQILDEEGKLQRKLDRMDDAFALLGKDILERVEKLQHKLDQMDGQPALLGKDVTAAEPAQQGRLCSACGSELDAEALFCTNCGKKIEE